jgi:ABC-2 type transport system permease protein
MLRLMVDRIARLLKHVRLTLSLTLTNILAAMEYRTSFWIQIVGMLLNDVALVLMWVIFFQRFPSINGWTMQDTIGIWAITTMSFGIVMTVGRGAFEIARGIQQGELDYYLSFPKDVLWHMSVSKTEISAIGDLIFGLGLIVVAGNITFERVVLYLTMSLMSAMICYNFIVVTQSIAFFVSGFEDAAQDFFHALLGFSMYPQTVFSGVLKAIMITVLPAFFAYWVPVRLVRQFDLGLFGWLLLFWALSFVLAVGLFRYGLRRYESGNLIHVKM